MKHNLKLILSFSLCLFLFACIEKKVVVDKDASAIIFYESGTITKKINLNDKGLIDNIQTFKNNRLESKWIADNSNLNPFSEYYGNGQIKVKGFLKNNQKHSLWSYYDRDGHLLIDRYFNYGEPTSIWIWYDKYNNHDVDKYELYDDKRGDGSITRYFQSSNIKEVKTYTRNQLNGEYSLYYDNPNNTLNIKGEYLLGSKIGNWEVFDLEGNFQNYFE